MQTAPLTMRSATVPPRSTAESLRETVWHIDCDDGAMDSKKSALRTYVRFLAMIGTSMVVMFLLMYLHSYQLLDHAWFSETRVFMTLIMGAGMIWVMLGFMWDMYPSRPVNVAILGGGLVLFAGALWLVRSQRTVGDTDYMEGMIPHHSIAILTSERAQINDPRVRELADQIIAAQRREISEMEWLIDDIRENGEARDNQEAAQRPVPDFSSAPE
jgi:hypothetical protein